MGAQPSSASSASKIATDAFDELDAKPINHAQLAGLLRSENADLLAVTSRYAGVRCSLLVRAMQRQDARAVQGVPCLLALSQVAATTVFCAGLCSARSHH